MAESKISAHSNVYTGLLALAALALTVAIAMVCYYGGTYYDSIFKVTV